jgi:hypothetical protein
MDGAWRDCGCTEDVFELDDALHNLCYQSRCASCPSTLAHDITYPPLQNTESRHRYSEFESLRLNMTKLYPTLIIPPIPSKQTIGDYAAKQSKAKEDVAMIARRKRMLQTFLNRVARHPILSNEHVFHRFLDGEVSWVRFTGYPVLLVGALVLIYPQDGSIEFSASLPAAEEHPEGTRAQPNRPERRARLCRAAKPFRGASAAAARPAIPGLGGVHEQVCVTPRGPDGEGDPARHEALGGTCAGSRRARRGVKRVQSERAGPARWCDRKDGSSSRRDVPLYHEACESSRSALSYPPTSLIRHRSCKTSSRTGRSLYTSMRSSRLSSRSYSPTDTRSTYSTR